MPEKLKSILTEDAYFYAIFLLLVAVVSFGLGRASVGGLNTHTQQSVFDTAGIKPLIPNSEPQVANNDLGQAVIASKSGSKYHLASCPGATQIKDTNRIEFTSREAAEAAGYTPAANCPGLE